MPGITAGTRKHGKAGMCWTEDIENVTRSSVNDRSQLMEDRKSWLH